MLNRTFVLALIGAAIVHAGIAVAVNATNIRDVDRKVAFMEAEPAHTIALK